MTILLLEKSKEVERRTQELAALQKSIQDQWNWYNHCGRTWGWRCRECLRVLPLIRADEAQVPSFQARINPRKILLAFCNPLQMLPHNLYPLHPRVKTSPAKRCLTA